jgi:4-hydroxyproline epimerase
VNSIAAAQNASPVTAPARMIRVIDSHTGGEPTRVVIAGGPDLPAVTLAEQLQRLRSEHDDLRRICIH